MSAYDDKKFIANLEQKWLDKRCPICSAKQWGISEKVLELREFQTGNLVIGGTIQPVVPITCSNCGYTILFNGLITGAVGRTDGSSSK